MPGTGQSYRFGGIERLYGVDALARLRQAHAAVVGLGGVGSWTAEALARSGVGRLTLVDLDEVCISNVNRQLHALDGEFGRPKVEVMARRIRAINPDCSVRPLQVFFTARTAEALLAEGFDVVVDTIDRPVHKCLLIARCRAAGIRVVTTGGAGGRRHPTAIRVADLAASSHDVLLQAVRRTLRREHGFPREGPFGVDCAYSTEPPVFPAPDGTVCTERPPDADLRLDCTRGYGTATFVTGAFGFAAAALAVQRLTEACAQPPANGGRTVQDRPLTA